MKSTNSTGEEHFEKFEELLQAATIRNFRIVAGASLGRIDNHLSHLMTRNVADFEATGVMLINPWDDNAD